MARTADEFKIVAGDEFKRVIKVLKLQDKTLPRKIKAKLRQTAKPTLAKVKAKALTLPTEGRQHSGLRKRVARGVKLKINRSVSSVRIITTVKDPEEAMLPRGLDDPKGWRHPVFGDKDEWVQQPGHEEWLRETVWDDRESFYNGMEDVLDEARDMVIIAGLG